MTTLYFGYGSNLNTRDLAAWLARRGFPADCIQPVRRAVLADHELCFDYYSCTRGGGALDVRPCRGSLVEGMLFRCTPDGWRALDLKEGAGGGFYERLPVVLADERGQRVEAVTYRACEESREDHVPPTPDYLRLVVEGCRLHGVPEEPVFRAARGEAPALVDSVFVYGTLMRGQSRFAALGRLECCLLARMPGRLYDLGAFPAARLGDGWVAGEFVRLAEPCAALERLDAIEGYLGPDCAGNLYRRELVHVDVGEGRIHPAWTYLYNEELPEGRLIASGDWRAHQGVRDEFLQELVEAYGDEEELTRRLDALGPFPYIIPLRPLWRALARGHVSERRLLQALALRPSCA